MAQSWGGMLRESLVIRRRQPWFGFALLGWQRVRVVSLKAREVLSRAILRSSPRLDVEETPSRRTPAPIAYFASTPGFDFFEESGLARLVTALALVGVGFAFGVLARSGAEEAGESGEDFDSTP